MEDIPGRPALILSFLFFSFLKGNRGGIVDLGEREVGAGEGLIGVKGEETAIGI